MNVPCFFTFFTLSDITNSRLFTMSVSSLCLIVSELIEETLSLGVFVREEFMVVVVLNLRDTNICSKLWSLLQ